MASYMTGTDLDDGKNADGRRMPLPTGISLGTRALSSRLERGGQILWVPLVALMLAYFLATIPGIIRVSERVCRDADPSNCMSSQLTLADL